MTIKVNVFLLTSEGQYKRRLFHNYFTYNIITKGRHDI